MSEKVLITFATDSYESKRFETNTLAAQTVDRIIDYRPDDLDKNFTQQNNHILSKTRGFGYWIWKPYVILKTLELLDDFSVLIYCDAGDTFTSNIVSIAQECLDDGVMLVESNYKNYQFTKSDCFVLMGCNDSRYWESNQVYASISFWRKTDKSLSLLKEWLEVCKNLEIISDSPSVLASDHPEFKEHRHDQSILTNLAIKNNIYTRKEKSSNPWDVF